MRRSGGLLIVNADDLGRTAAETDSVLDCWRAGGISSATHMVWMSDSDRAAELAREAALPTGLHLNLSQPYSAPDVPPDVRERQAALARHYRGRRGARIRAQLYDPRLRRQVDRVVADQLARYRELHGGDPTHVDGHHHLHLVPTVLFSPALPRELPVRRAFTFLDGERPAASRAVRSARNRMIARRFRTTDWLFDLAELHPALRGGRLEQKLGLARSGSVEVMAHPGRADEHALLTGDDWQRALEGLSRGSFAALA